MTIAGLYDTWAYKESDDAIKSCAMVVTAPNKLVAEVHDRMPVVQEKEDLETWLTGNGDEVKALMRPAPDDLLQTWPVSKRVNSSRADDADATLIEPIAASLLETATALNPRLL
jgi:putative SOS response-associated peptidase YedK